METVKAAAEEADAVGQQESGLERMPVLIVDRTPKALEAQVALLSRYGCKLAIAARPSKLNRFFWRPSQMPCHSLP